MRHFFAWSVLLINVMTMASAQAGTAIISCKSGAPSTTLTIPSKDGSKCKWMCLCNLHGSPQFDQQCPQGESINPGTAPNCNVSAKYLDIFTELPSNGKCPTQKTPRAVELCNTTCAAQKPGPFTVDCAKKFIEDNTPRAQ